MLNLICRHQILVYLVFFAFAWNTFAQEAPPIEDDPPATEQRRIVESRPGLYSFKRAINPLTWIEAGTRPLGRSAESGFINRFMTRKSGPDKIAGVKVKLTGTGSGSGFGPQITPYHDNLFGRGIEVEMPLLYTYKHYQAYGFNARVPLASGTFVDRLTFDLGTAYRSRARDNFAGIGNESVLEDRKQFRAVTREASLGLSAAVSDEWKSGLHVAYRNTGVTRPRGGSSAQDAFLNADVPGLFTGAELLSTELSFDHDTRGEDALPVSGGVEHLEFSLNEGLGKGDFSYWKYRFEFQRFFPLTSDRRKVIAVRGMAETNQEKGGSRIPFFDMPTLGNWGTLRGFQNYRFYDKSGMSAGIEYRYRIWRPVDWAFFVDVGQVAPEIGDFGWNRFHTGYGIRLIGMPKPNAPISIDVARSREQWNFYVNFNKRF